MNPRDLEPDDDGPALVRPYALVRGRTRTGSAESETLPVEAIVVTLDGRAERLGLERGAIVALCATPHSIAEVSAHVHLPVGVVRVLVADLRNEGIVQVNLPIEPGADGTTDRALLERVLAGLEAL